MGVNKLGGIYVCLFYLPVSKLQIRGVNLTTCWSSGVLNFLLEVIKLVRTAEAVEVMKPAVLIVIPQHSSDYQVENTA